MKRREFLQLGLTGLAAITVGSVTLPQLLCRVAYASGPGIELTMEPALVEMVDRTQVFHWLFASTATGPTFPGPVIFATAGESVSITITNHLLEPHAFQILGTGVNTAPIAPGKSATVQFTAPAAGSYLYLDPLNAPVHRVLGLHSALIVTPAAGNTPYSTPTQAVQQLFNDLGNSPHFPKFALGPAGWDPARFRIWLQHQVDPAFNARAKTDFLAGRASTVSAAQLQAGFLPRYFTINGRSGVFAAHDPGTKLTGRIGEPMLVRILNTGLFTHSNHIHANHVYVLAVNGAVQENVFFIDSFSVAPLDRIDWLVAFIRPPDIAGDPSVPLRQLIPNELALTVRGPNGSPGVPQSPLGFPMHCHMETSQTAAGGNYPQGTVTHFDFLGDVDGVDFPDVT